MSATRKRFIAGSRVHTVKLKIHSNVAEDKVDIVECEMAISNGKQR